MPEVATGATAAWRRAEKFIQRVRASYDVLAPRWRGGRGGEEDVALVRSWAVPLRRHAKKRARGLRPDVYSDPFFSAMSRLMELTELNQLVRQHELLLLQLLEQVAIFPHLIP